jgi:predicted nucleic acid-binding protein
MEAANRGDGFGKTATTETTSDGGLTEMALDPPLLLDASIWVAAYDVDDRFHDNSRELTFDNALNAAALDLTLFEVANVVAKRWGGFSVAEVVARRYDWTLVSTDIRDLVSKGLAITPDAAV